MGGATGSSKAHKLDSLEHCGAEVPVSYTHLDVYKRQALGLPLTDVERKMYHIAPDMELSPLANAYARARGADRIDVYKRQEEQGLMADVKENEFRPYRDVTKRQTCLVWDKAKEKSLIS